MFSFLTQTTTLKGVTCDVILAEEASSIPRSTMEEVIGPLFKMQQVTAIYISTMMDSSNPYSELLEKKDPLTGKPLLHQVRITLVCERSECRSDPTKCFHMIHRIPYYQSIAQHLVSQAMISSSHVAARELYGLVMDDGVKVFSEDDVESTFSRVTSNLNKHGSVRFAITSVDPNNDGKSFYAITTILVTDLTWIVRKPFPLFFLL